MNLFKIAIGMVTFAAATMAQAGFAQVPLPVLEGGLLTAGVVGLVAGIRAIQRKK